MKRIIYFLLLLIIGTSNIYSQGDPGFGDEGGGDGQDAPVAPIDGITLPLLVTGIVTAIVLIRKQQRHSNC